MSRLDDDLRRDFGAIAERVTPSPNAWEAIQQRIADREPDTETEIIMLTENTTTRRRGPLLAAAAALIILAVGAIALFATGDTDEVPADEPDPTVAPEPDGEVDGTGSEVTDIGAQFSGRDLEPGRYSAGMLGVPITFEVPATTATPWRLETVDSRRVTIETPDAWINLIRVGSYLDATEAQDPDFTGLGSIPPDDIDAWIEANDVVVDTSDDATVAGRDAQFRVVRAPAGADVCPEGLPTPCIAMGTDSTDVIGESDSPGVILGEGAWGFWVVELDEFEPLSIEVWPGPITDGDGSCLGNQDAPGAPDEIGDGGSCFVNDPDLWLDEVGAFVESIELGEPAPSVEGGTARISTFGTDG